MFPPGARQGHALPDLRNNPGTGPAASIDIILQDEQDRRIQPAIWWLLLEKAESGYKPSRYTSFNTRSDKLDQNRSAGYRPYRSSRCIVPATYITEGEGTKGARRYHRIEPTESAFALGGLYRTWLDKTTGGLTYSCSIITLPPHPDVRWQDMHSKSMPLMLPTDKPDTLHQWLDPAFDQVEAFQPLLQPRFPGNLRCVPVERPGNQREVGDSFIIEKQ